jgi:predicted site-specific integrase-resolvase
MRGKANATIASSARTAEGAGKLIGYARVSTADQDLAVQRQALALAGVGVIFEEKASGTKRDGRMELQKVLSVLGNGDALVVTRLDRLGRSLRDLANIVHEIEQVGAHLKVIEQDVDTSTAPGRAFFGMFSSPPSRQTCAESASWKASRWPSARARTRVARRASTASA